MRAYKEGTAMEPMDDKTFERMKAETNRWYWYGKTTYLSMHLA